MTTAYCIDVSGSVSDEQIKAAFSFVQKGIEPGDCIIVFDGIARKVTLDWANTSLRLPVLRGGSRSSNALDFAKLLGCYGTVLISDGYCDPINGFSKFIDVNTLKK